MMFIIHDSRKISPKYEYSKFFTENSFIALLASVPAQTLTTIGW